jgi:Plasmid pRiA4b ORF-3-like protein
MPTTYTLKVTLDGVKPAIWRRFVVPGELPLDQLHGVLQTVMGWTDSHLHAFEAGPQRYELHSPNEDTRGSKDERGVPLETVLKTKGATLLYRYDFGDRWCHTVLVEEITPGSDAPVPALCLGGQRACPPEDVGGPHRYAEFTAALADPAHPRHDYWLDWIEIFDTELFELSRVNRNLGWRR